MSNDPSERYLFVLLGALGDVVRGMSLVDALKHQKPDCHITWLVEPASKGVVALHAGVDDIVVFQRDRGLFGAFALWRELRKRHFDVTFDLQRHAKSGLFSWMSGAHIRVGFHRKDTKEGNWLFNNRFIAQQGENISKVDHYLLFLGALGLRQPSLISFGLEHHSLEKTEAAWKQRLNKPYVALILGSSWDSKDWPQEGYAALLNYLRDYQVVLLGDKSKVEMGVALKSKAAGSNVLDLCGKTTLSELVAVIKDASVCVGPDSGPGHIAGALGTPHVTLFGPTSVVRNAPRGSERLAITADVGCAPCKRRICPGLNKICMRLIRPEEVYEKLVPFLSRSSFRKT